MTDWQEAVIMTRAVDRYGRQSQVDMAIEEMAELTTELMHERRGREHHIAEEIADVQIMLYQLEYAYGIIEDVRRIRETKLVRLDERLKEE